jgi:hypothetical protein
MNKEEILEKITQKRCYDEDCVAYSLEPDWDALAEFLATLTTPSK